MGTDWQAAQALKVLADCDTRSKARRAVPKQETAPPCAPLRCTQASRRQHLGLISKAGAIASPWLQALRSWRASSRVLGFKSRPQTCTPCLPWQLPFPTRPARSARRPTQPPRLAVCADKACCRWLLRNGDVAAPGWQHREAQGPALQGNRGGQPTRTSAARSSALQRAPSLPHAVCGQGWLTRALCLCAPPGHPRVSA